MPWINPKTTWENGETFELDPDYDRIKGNISYLIEVGRDAYPSLVDPGLGTYTIYSFAPSSFFTDIVNAVIYIKDNTFTPYGWRTLSTNYSARIWDAADLNAIEEDIKLLYEGLAPGVIKYRSGLYKAGEIPNVLVK